jgi:hypothetical protein
MNRCRRNAHDLVQPRSTGLTTMSISVPSRIAISMYNVGNNAGTGSVITFHIRLVAQQAVPEHIILHSSMRARSYNSNTL